MPGFNFPHTCTFTHIPDLKFCFMIGGGIPPTVTKLNCDSLKAVYKLDFTYTTTVSNSGR